MSLEYITPDEVLSVWDKVKEYLNSANTFGGNKFEERHWVVKLLTGNADLFIDDDKAAVVCEVTRFPLKSVYGIILLGGLGGHDWSQYQKTFERSARARGCTCLEVFGRPGWRKILDEQGYKLQHYVWSKDL